VQQRIFDRQMVKEGTKKLKEANIIGVIIQSLQMAQCLLVRSCLEGADLVIKPKVSHIGFGDFHRAKECIAQGERAAQASMPEIARILGICRIN
jgi:NTE family protein